MLAADTKWSLQNAITIVRLFSFPYQKCHLSIARKRMLIATLEIKRYGI